MTSFGTRAAAGVLLAALAGCQGLEKDLMADALQRSGHTLVGDAMSSVDSRVSGAARPAMDAFVELTVARLLSVEDRRAVEIESAEALSGARDGETVTWSNPASGARATITPGNTRTEEREVVIVREKAVAAPPPLELLGQPYRAKTNATLRSGPSTESERVGNLAAREEFTAVGRTEGAPWLLVGRGGKSVGYLREDLAEPGDPVAASGLQRPVNLDEMEVPEGAVAERVAVRTQCRGLQVKVEDKDGKQADDSLQACRAADGAWEL